jgi:photosystem II stability/assembly factor-like uncharacterized protein
MRTLPVALILCFASLFPLACREDENPIVLPDTPTLPALHPGPGQFDLPMYVMIKCSTPGTTIRYTTNGALPSDTGAHPIANGDSVLVDTTMTIKAMAVGPGGTSQIAAGVYTIAHPTPWVRIPTFKPSGGIYALPMRVQISCATAGASIRYTTDGSTPTTTNGILLAPEDSTAPLEHSCRLKAIAFKLGYKNSPETSAFYDIMAWKQIASPTSSKIEALAFHPSGAAFTTAWNTVFRSPDKGNSWQPVLTLPTKQTVKRLSVTQGGGVFIAIQRDTLIKLPGMGAYAGDYITIFYSSDQGGNWQQLYEAGGSRESVLAANGLTTDGNGTVMIALLLGGIALSIDNGTSWTRIESFNPTGNYIGSTVDVAISTGGTFFVSSEGSGLHRSTDRGITWVSCPCFPPDNAPVGRLLTTPDGLLYAWMWDRTGKHVYVSKDEGNSATSGLSAEIVEVLAYAPSSGAVYAGTDNDLFKTTDHGATWRSQGFPGIDVTAMAIAADGTEIVGTSTGAIYRRSGQ